MPLKAKHIVEELNGQRCTIVEKGATSERVEFLKNLLEFNKFEVIITEDKVVIAEDKKDTEDAPTVFTIGVTDLVFNPVIAVYELVLKTQGGKKVSPAYWEQKTTMCVDEYWEFEEK